MNPNTRKTQDVTDDYPTPPWAVRALVEYFITPVSLASHTVLEPCSGRGYLANTLREYGANVFENDKYDYGNPNSSLGDFLNPDYHKEADYIITNPPFILAEEFVLKALMLARHMVCVFERTNFLEGKGRHERLFSKTPPSFILPFVERVQMARGRLVPKMASVTPYSWFVWFVGDEVSYPKVKWIPPCRNRLEKPEDYGTSTN